MTSTMAKTKLRRATWIRVIDVLLIVIGVAFFLFGAVLLEWFFLLAVVGWLSLLLFIGSFDRINLTPDFLQKNSSKILYGDLVEVREFFWWYIVWDRYGDSLWIPVRLLDEDSRERLIGWLKGEGVGP